jgi:transcriptional regulator with XRE-family HTH domain
MAKLCDRLKEALIKREMKASTLAYKTGISEASLSHYLSGHYSPKGDKLNLIANALRVSPAWLGGYDVPMDAENKSPVAELTLSDGERALVNLFRSASPYQQEIILQLLAAKITPKE